MAERAKKRAAIQRARLMTAEQDQPQVRIVTVPIDGIRPIRALEQVIPALTPDPKVVAGLAHNTQVVPVKAFIDADGATRVFEGIGILVALRALGRTEVLVEIHKADERAAARRWGGEQNRGKERSCFASMMHLSWCASFFEGEDPTFKQLAEFTGHPASACCVARQIAGVVTDKVIVAAGYVRPDGTPDYAPILVLTRAALLRVVAVGQSTGPIQYVTDALRVEVDASRLPRIPRRAKKKVDRESGNDGEVPLSIPTRSDDDDGAPPSPHGGVNRRVLLMQVAEDIIARGESDAAVVINGQRWLFRPESVPQRVPRAEVALASASRIAPQSFDPRQTTLF